MKGISAVILLLVFLAVTLCPLPAAAATSATHPLEPLSAAEFKTTYKVVRAHFAARGLPTDPILFPAIELHRHVGAR